MQILLISGKSASGKDTFANYLRKELESKSKRVLTIHFADMVKEYAKLYYGWNGEKDEYGRSLLQKIGTEIVRKKFDNYWADMVGQFLSAVEETGDFDYVLVPDMRFKNECTRVKKFNKNVLTIRINRLNADGTYYYNPSMTEEQNKHSSECSLDDFVFDIMIDNSGTIEEFYTLTKDFCAKLLSFSENCDIIEA